LGKRQDIYKNKSNRITEKLLFFINYIEYIILYVLFIYTAKIITANKFFVYAM